MVAKSFQTLELVGEPYAVAGRQYIKVRTKTGTLKQVRWYTDKEYAKMYPDEPISNANDPFYKTQKEVLGFQKGYITIFKGNTYEDKEYFKASEARYTRLWGWYFMSNMDLPKDLPNDVEPVRLDWDLVGNDDGKLKPEDVVVAAVEKLIYDPDPSEFQGEVGDKVEVLVVVENAIKLDNNYGTSVMHFLRDYNGNLYIWTTMARSWPVGSEHYISGTIKALRTYRGAKETVLTRCREKSL